MTTEQQILEFAVVGSPCPGAEEQKLAAMALMLSSKRKHFLGITEENFLAAMDKIGVQKDEAFQTLSWLIEQHLVVHQLSQEGSAGPFFHRYKVNGERVRIKVYSPQGANP